ncbi:DNA-directed RNA polymerase subunit beta [Hordeum vulgare]|nr:DNA-directed RNA polymerase subunit beta [Hordeum vulgare]
MEVMEGKEGLLEETKGKTKEENPALDEGKFVLNKEEAEEEDLLQPYLHLLSPSLIKLLMLCEITHVVDLGLEVINSVIDPGEVLPNVIGIDLVLVGELRDHHVVGAESAFHHPLSLEDLLLHCFEPRLHASGLLGPLNITDMQHPLMHLDRLRVLPHSREVGIDDLLKELVLQNFWGCHSDLDLSAQ